MTIVFGLAAAALYGAADFLGGIASRRTPAFAVVFVSQISGGAVLLAAWLFVPGRFYADDVAWGILAGVVGAVAISALYASLAIGRMGVVSPVTAVLGASVPVLAGFVLGQRPSVTGMAGVACAFLAVGLVSANAETRRISRHEPGIGLALLAGILIGVMYVLLGRAHADSGLARLVAMRSTYVAAFVAFALVRRTPLRPANGTLSAILWAGALDMGANVLYVLAARSGLLAIAAVLTSLYPASTVFLARVVLHERLTATQWAGVALAACGIALIAL